MRYPQLLDTIEKGKVEPFYIIRAEDDNLLKATSKRIKEILFKEKTNIFNYHSFSGKETTAATILNMAKTLPFSSEKRFIIVEEVEKMKILERKKLFSYLANPVTSTTLFLFIKGKLSELLPSINLIRLKKGDFGQITKEIKPFDLTLGLEKKDLVKAFKVFDSLLLKERDFPRILGMLAWWLRQKSKLKRGIDKELLEKFNELRATELKIKRGKVSPRLGLELLLIRLAQ